MKNFILSLLQFLSLLYLFISGPFYIFSIPFVLIQFLSLLFIFWALLVKYLYRRPASRSAPKSVYFLKEGPYEIIRHPVYAGLLLIVLNYVPGYFSIFQYLAFLLLLILTFLRIHRDEELTESYFKHEYIKYKKQTRCLIPYIY